jgi:predicted HTH domain antitoxin
MPVVGEAGNRITWNHFLFVQGGSQNNRKAFRADSDLADFLTPHLTIMRYPENMQTVRLEIPAELVAAAGLDADKLSEEATRLLALELYREDRISLGRASELCHLPVEQFMEFSGRHNVPFHFAAGDLDEDRRTLQRLGL